MIFYNCKNNLPPVGLTYLVKLPNGRIQTAEYWSTTKVWYSDLDKFEVLNPTHWANFPHESVFISKEIRKVSDDPLEMIVYGIERTGFWWTMVILFTLIAIASHLF